MREIHFPGGDPRMLRATFGPVPAMPRAQTALLALRDIHPRTADAVLERARLYYAQDA